MLKRGALLACHAAGSEEGEEDSLTRDCKREPQVTQGPGTHLLSTCRQSFEGSLVCSQDEQSSKAEEQETKEAGLCLSFCSDSRSCAFEVCLRLACSFRSRV